MSLQIVYFPDPRLRQLSKPVKDFEAVKEVVDSMFDVMYRCRGIGLAGPQVGVLQRIIVANLTGKKEEKAEERVFLNPEIVERSGSMQEIEGCLSFPGIEATIKRSEKVLVEVTDLGGERHQFDATGLWSKLFQHEIDHLDGILFLDKMSAADKKQAAPRLRELEEDFENHVVREHRPAKAGL